MARISVIIQYCHSERFFYTKLIQQCKIFSSDITVVTFDKRFDGSLEPRFVNADPTIRHVEYTIPSNGISAWDAHTFARDIHLADERSDYVLLIDADEVPEGGTFLQFTRQLGTNVTSMKLANFVYYKSMDYRALALQDSVVLVNRRIDYNPFENKELDRNRFINMESPRMVTFRDKVMFHHFSWVRPKTDIAAKIKSWGHNNDRDWKPVLDTWDTFDETCKDPVWSYNYIKIKNQWGIHIPN